MSELSPKQVPGDVQDQPLGLSVHSLEVPGRKLIGNTAGRWKMIAVLLVCASPVIASYFTYYVVRPDGRRNFGELVIPQRHIPAIATIDLDGKTGELLALEKQWLLISVGDAACPQQCQKRLYFQRQLREALGKEKGRMDRVWLITDNAPVDDKLRPALVGSTALRVPADQLTQWLSPAPSQKVDEHLYLVDPLGNLMLRFPANMDAAGAAKAKRDIDRVLRASSGWDKEGRLR